jgi:hypothetical protein
VGPLSVITNQIESKKGLKKSRVTQLTEMWREDIRGSGALTQFESLASFCVSLTQT